MNGVIRMEQWDKHFQRLLGDERNRLVKGKRGGKIRAEKDEERDIEKEEIRKVMKSWRRYGQTEGGNGRMDVGAV